MMTNPKPAHLVVLGERRAIGWVLENEVVAFPEQRYKNTFPTFETGDVVYLYATRGAFHNPNRDRGRVFARAVVKGPVERTDDPYEFRGRALPLMMPVAVERLAPVFAGVEIAELVPQMTSFPKPDTWSVYLRRSTYPLTPEDSELIEEQLAAVAGTRQDYLEEYRRRTSARVSVAREGNQ